MDAEFRIEPEPPDTHRQAIVRAVEQLLEREEQLARPSSWRLSGWVAQRAGITDLARWFPSTRVWPLSTRLPRGGREYPGLGGRGDAK